LSVWPPFSPRFWSAGITSAIRPLLLRVALAKPNARSSHRTPTPQGAGIAGIAATLITAGAITALAGSAGLKIPFAVFGVTLLIAVVGFADDLKSITVPPRLLPQGHPHFSRCLNRVLRRVDFKRYHTNGVHLGILLDRWGGSVGLVSGARGMDVLLWAEGSEAALSSAAQAVRKTSCRERPMPSRI